MEDQLFLYLRISQKDTAEKVTVESIRMPNILWFYLRIGNTDILGRGLGFNREVELEPLK